MARDGQSRRLVTLHSKPRKYVARPRRKIFPHRRRIVLGIVSQIEAAKADAFAISRPVHDQACDAARDQIGYTLEVLNLLGDIETLEENHGRHFACTALRVGVNIDCGKARAFMCDFDVLQTWPLDVFGGVAKTSDAAHIGFEPILTLWLQEALADMIVRARALQILCAARRVAIV